MEIGLPAASSTYTASLMTGIISVIGGLGYSSDYQVNLKAELEIRHLHQKVDHPLSEQGERLVEIQEIRMELISEVRGRR
jgi:hypothetical protein